MFEQLAMIPPQAAARNLLKTLNAPAWAVSVAVTIHNDQTVLVVRVDPGYRINKSLPRLFDGYPVAAEIRTPTKAQFAS